MVHHLAFVITITSRYIVLVVSTRLNPFIKFNQNALVMLHGQNSYVARTRVTLYRIVYTVYLEIKETWLDFLYSDIN